MNENAMTMEQTGLDRRGFAMVTTLLVVLVLSVMAVAVVWISTSEKKTSFAEAVHTQSTYSADAGGEAGINFIRVADTPPRIVDFGTRSVNNVGNTIIHGSQSYDYACRYVRKSPRPGWGVNYKDFEYRVISNGKASTKGQSAVQLVATRLFKEGY